jgi:hypothetical protein
MRNYNPLPDLTGGTPLAWGNLVNFKENAVAKEGNRPPGIFAQQMLGGRVTPRLPV